MELASQPKQVAVTTKEPAKVYSLDSLAGESCASLELLFRAARWEACTSIEGHPRGRMLAVPGLDGSVLGKLVASYATSVLMPWEGKSFRTTGPGTGEGTNRVRIGKRSTAFRFRTYVTASQVDGQPAFAIDYDLPENPRLARGVYDELRPVAPGLFLGRGMQKSKGGVRLLLWFALDARQQDASLSY